MPFPSEPRLLDYLVQSYPYPMLEYVSRMKELLDYFTFMHGKTSIRLVKAILPLVKYSHDLQVWILLLYYLKTNYRIHKEVLPYNFVKCWYLFRII